MKTNKFNIPYRSKSVKEYDKLFKHSYLFLIFSLLTYGLPAQSVIPSTTENFVHTIEPIDEVTSVDGQTSGIRTIQYIDGLGRPKQTLQVKSSTPESGSVFNDMVIHFEYDSYGRPEKDYLPAPTGQSNGVYISNPLNSLNAYYGSSEIYYYRKEFEKSPLSRVVKQAAPGNDWNLNSGHEIKFDYQSNTSGDIVKKFKVTLGNQYTPSLQDTGYHEAGSLYKLTTTDENGERTIEFRNKLNQVILKRKYVTPDNTADRGINPDTDLVVPVDIYYVYDGYGNLTYVIPPLASGKPINETTLQELYYIYKYDERNRLIEKKIPGKGWEWMVYDKQDRLIAFKDAKQVEENNNEWNFIKYDKFGRVVYTGLVSDAANRQNLQSILNSNYGSNNAEYDATGFMHDNLKVYYKANKGYPTGNFQILTINYYDFYAPSRQTDQVSFPALGIDLRDGSSSSTESLRGLLTSTVTRIMGTTVFEKTYNFYDIKSRPVWSHKINHLGGYTKIQNNLDFRGKPNSTIIYHKYNASSTEIKIQDLFTYDAQERIKSDVQLINNGSAERIANNTYNRIGQLEYKLVGNRNSLPALQSVDYTYNIRGWLTAINDITENLQLNRGIPGAPLGDIFAFKIQHNDLIYGGEAAAEPLYNGNISQTFWKSASDNILKGYTYGYDQLNRLRTSDFYRAGTNPYPGAYNEYIAYDLNGNMLNLIRSTGDANNNPINMDNLTYTYIGGNGNSNRLLKITDAVTTGSNDGFSNGSSGTSNDYTYDGNGNMTSDKNKGITSIEYNSLNLPVKIKWNNSETKKIEYLYNAAGIKVQKKVTNGGNVKVVDYLGGFQYAGGVLQFFPTAEGYVKATKITGGGYLYNYAYNYTDHLGNIRLTYAKDPETGDLKILDENHYYPFGLEHKIYAGSITKDFKEDQGNGTVVLDDVTKTDYMYKFQSQELQDELSLNWYGFKWRNYDPAMARFTAIDPLADQYPDWGAYVFSGNRVIDARELEGLEPEIMNGDDYGLGGMEDLFGSVDLEPANIGGFKPEKLQEAYEVDEDESTFTKWNNIHGGEYDNRIEAYRAWQSDSNYHNGESFWDKTFRSMGYASMEARRDFASGGMNMYGGYGRIVKAVESAGSATKALTPYYPANGGALGKWTTTTLEAGAKIDRYGLTTGKYFSPAGTPLGMRSLPPGNYGAPIKYEVVTPFEVQTSTVAPWFNSPGLGTQYYSPFFNAQELIMGGFIKAIP